MDIKEVIKKSKEGDIILIDEEADIIKNYGKGGLALALNELIKRKLRKR